MGDTILDVAVDVLDLVRPEVDGALYLFGVAPDLLHHSSRTRFLRPSCSGSPRVFQMWACSATILSVTFLAPIRIGNGSCTGGRFSFLSLYLMTCIAASSARSLSPAVPNS